MSFTLPDGREGLIGGAGSAAAAADQRDLDRVVAGSVGTAGDRQAAGQGAADNRRGRQFEKLTARAGRRSVVGCFVAHTGRSPSAKRWGEGESISIVKQKPCAAVTWDKQSR